MSNLTLQPGPQPQQQQHPGGSDRPPPGCSEHRWENSYFKKNVSCKMMRLKCLGLGVSEGSITSIYTRYKDALAVTSVITRSRRRRHSFTNINKKKFQTNIKCQRLTSFLYEPSCSVLNLTAALSE